MGERPVPVPGVDVMFTDEDIEEFLEHFANEDARCPGCGNDRRRSFGQQMQDRYTAKVLQCFSCEAKDRRAASFEGERHGVYFVAVEDTE